MAFAPSSGISSRVSFPNDSSNIGLTQPVSASDFTSSVAGKIGAAVISRYGPVLFKAAVSRADRTVGDFADRVSGSKRSGRPPTKLQSTRDNNADTGDSTFQGGGDGNKGDGTPGGRRKIKNKDRGSGSPGTGGVLDVNGVTRFGIDTGVDSGILFNPLQSTTKHYTPLFIQCGCLFPNFEEQDDSTFSSLINSDLYFKYLIIVQSVITNSFSRYFTEVNFFTYIGRLSYALQVYYMIDSILAYTVNSSNTNMAMYRLRMAITPDIVSGHLKLKEYLESIPIPPNLTEYIRYMYQNFCFNEVSGSSIIRLSVDDSLCTSEYNGGLGLNAESYFSITEGLIDCNQTISIIKRIRENWIKPLPPSSYEAITDSQFSTFWHNSNICYEDYGSKDIKYTINCSSRSDLLYYGVFDNRLDGIIYASCSVNDKNGVQQIGMWVPFSDMASRNSINSSLLHFANDGLVRPVTDVSFRNASMVHAAPYTIISKSGNPEWVVTESHFAGSAIPQVHTLENTTQAVVNSVNWLLEPR